MRQQCQRTGKDQQNGGAVHQHTQHQQHNIDSHNNDPAGIGQVHKEIAQCLRNMVDGQHHAEHRRAVHNAERCGAQDTCITQNLHQALEAQIAVQQHAQQERVERAAGGRLGRGKHAGEDAA